MSAPSPATISLTCGECGDARDATRHYIQDAIRVREPGRITVDWDAGTAVHTCRRCTQSAKLRAMNAATVKRHGRGALRDRGQRLAAWNAEHPEARAAQVTAMKAARATWSPSAIQTARLKLGRLRLDLNGTLSLCGICHRLMFMEARHVERFHDEGRENVGRFHQACLLTWRGSDEMRAWQSAWRRARTTGQPEPEMPVPPRPADRMSSEAELVEAHATTVRYFWIRNESGRADRDEHGRVRTVAWLARDLGVNRDALYKRIGRFLSLLPNETAATGRTAIWRDIFLTLESPSASTPENAIHVAQP